jgi:putative hydrolase of the HAD superfamily
MLTKGNPTEQSGKVERSGLKDYFTAIEIVAEKDAATYGDLVRKYALAPRTTWMVGNSPKSDINPALAAGLNAVYVPHEMTWVLEKCELADGCDGRLLTVKNFADLRNHF